MRQTAQPDRSPEHWVPSTPTPDAVKFFRTLLRATEARKLREKKEARAKARASK